MKDIIIKSSCCFLAMILAFSLITIGAIAVFMDGYKTQKQTVEKDVQLHVLPLMDSYDSAGGDSIDSILRRDDIINDLNSLYADLLASEEFEYIPVTEPSVYYFGKYAGDADTIVGGETERNLANGEGFQTGLNTVQVNEEYSQSISESVVDGRCFENADFDKSYNQRIPVLLGAAFSEDFSIGDVLPVYYYMNRTELEVVGFTKLESVLDCGELGWYLDYYVILPEIELSNKSEDAMCNTIIMMDKCEAYFGVKDLNEIQSAIDKIESLAVKYDFKYDIDSLHNIANQMLSRGEDNESIRDDASYELSQNEKRICLALLVTGILLLISACFVEIRRPGISLRENMTKVKGLSVFVIIIVLQLIISYVAGYHIGVGILSRLFDSYANDYALIIHGNVRVGVFTLAILSCVTMCKCNKNGWRDER